MPIKTREEILKMANEMLEKDEGLRRALELFQLGQAEYLKALASTHVIQIFSDDKTTEDLSVQGDDDEKLG
ncbi:MAG TPA: hypothetical protein VFR47_01395 [Anaerolineales bacterium]|nr:hypothetical protein [Anaerolineales bacterium]